MSSFLANNNGGGGQSVPAASSGAVVQVTCLSNATFNVGGYFTNNAWTPPAGKIRVGGQARMTGTAVGSGTCIVFIYKNGAVFAESIYNSTNMNHETSNMVIWADDIAAGTDVYDLRIQAVIVTNPATISGAIKDTNFWGYVLAS